MKILRFIIIAFIIWYLPSFLLDVYGETVGSYASYLMFILIIGYFFISPKFTPHLPLIVLGILYFTFSGLNYTGEFDFFYYKFIKYIVFVIGVSELITRCKANILFLFLLVGGISIIINAVFFPHFYGRYSGFYLNPNLAGFTALLGFCFCFKISHRLLRLLGFVIFIFAGFLTFSRYFILMWIILSIISVILNRKNIEVILIGVGSGITILTIASLLQLNIERLHSIQNILGNQIDQGIKTLSKNPRVDTWALHTENIVNHLVFGNGFLSMSGVNNVNVGVHNALLLTVGEAGFIPFLIMVIIFGKLLYTGIKTIRNELLPGLLCLVLCSYLFVSHNFYDNYLLLFFILWVSWLLYHKNVSINTTSKTT